ncbi:ribonuclease R [Oceanidesulfovibrio indonesiensis]|uniref:Ribonuclease R n=1 Tax=Oceanidesulfovibrio indonesiensis TaxID=54767 RepID=A0A7M3MKE8_9BACT|nr:ribonuclease R [Oceanidesulfovibrio indonesiensis]TVM20048.1 ribonuclease R [Oceanidesulfovibrio indonesiensis]
MTRKKKSKKKGKDAWGLDPRKVVNTLREAGKPLSSQEIIQSLGASKKDKHRLKSVLHELMDKGKVYRLKRGAYGLPENLHIVTGTLEVQRSGVGFVLPDDKRRGDIFVHPGNMDDAWHDDRVAVALLPGRKGKRAEGRITKVLERGHKTLAVRLLRRLGEYFLLEPTEPRIKARFMLDDRDVGAEPEPHDIYMIEVGDQLDQGIWEAKFLAKLGQEADPSVQEELVKENHSVPRSFGQHVLAEANALPEHPSPQDLEGREDLRDMPFVTIDGAKARDFDDAVLVKREGKGWRLWVAIADVSHYVKAGTALDREARERGNSYYFPQSVEPMFPERLSNGLCSLNPDVERLVMVAEVPFSPDGQPGEAKAYNAVIRSHARLTYAQVKRVILDRNDDERGKVEHVLPMLEEAERLARMLHAVRRDRGTLDFDLPEPEIRFNLYGETVDITPKVRHFGHQIIEEFMIAANEAVARMLTEAERLCMYRIHPPPDPDKLSSLFDMLSVTELAEKLPKVRGGESVSPSELQQLLAAAEDTDFEFLVNRLTLRTMMQAKYSPQNEGHYGLASDCYCHFTSPIRRYADLVVHRSLKNYIAGRDVESLPGPTGMKSLGGALSDTERQAMDAEREILKRLTILFLQDKVGEEFTGVINGLADFGFWVEMEQVMAEGLVRLSSLDDDYYGYFPERQMLVGERTGKQLRLGQRVRVKLTDVNLSRLEVNLELIEAL